MPTVPHPDQVSKFIRGTVASAFQNLNNLSPSPPVSNPVTSTQIQPDSLKADDPPTKPEASPTKGHPQRRSRLKEHKPKYSPEQKAKHRTEAREGRARRDLSETRNMPPEGQPALERYIVPEEASTDEALHIGEAHPHPATTVPPSPPAPLAFPASHEQAEPKDSTDSSDTKDSLASPDHSAPAVSPHRLGSEENTESRGSEDSPTPPTTTVSRAQTKPEEGPPPASSPLPNHLAPPAPTTSHASIIPEEGSQPREDEHELGRADGSVTKTRRLSPKRSLFEMAFLPGEADIEAVGGEWVDVRREEGEEEWEKVCREYEDEE